MKALRILAVIGLFVSWSSFTHAAPLGTAFTYQGHVSDTNGPVTGANDFQFALFDAADGGAQQGPTVNADDLAASNGLFTVLLDFGASPFSGEARWLEIRVRPGDSVGDYTTLAPRQELAPAPYALYAPLAGNLPDTVTQQFNGAVTFGNAAGAPFVVVNPVKVSNLNADLLDGLDSSAFWKLAGNAGTVAGADFVGTTDNQALELKVNNARALRLEPNANAPNLIGGHSGNTVTPGVYAAFIGGGGTALQPNTVGANLGVIGGGRANTIALNSVSATIAGGEAHNIRANAPGGTIGGGVGNDIAEDSQYVTMPGGFINRVATNSGYSTVGGGGWNTLGARSSGATLAGGILNRLADETDYAAVGGGTENAIAQNSPAATIAGGRWNAIGASSSDSVIGGGYTNTIGEGSPYATIAGGYRGEIGPNADQSAIGGGWNNGIAANSFSATVAGGSLNAIRTNSDYSAIGGGWNNFIADNSPYATIAGGRLNYAGTNSHYSAIGGGYDNHIADNSPGATITGGRANDIGMNCFYSMIGGGTNNNIGTNSPYATIAGGFGNNVGTNSNSSAIGGGYNNNIGNKSVSAIIAGGEDNHIGSNTYSSAIGGGWDNDIGDNSNHATIAGGDANRIGTNASSSTIGGGDANLIGDWASDSTVAGGTSNDIGRESRGSVIGGGWNNGIGERSLACTIAGGEFNNVPDNSDFATIPGGEYSSATNYAFAAGRRAKANHTGAFVWADSANFDFPSTANNQFNVRATGGVRIVTGIDAAGNPDAGVSLNADDSSWNVISDRNAKKNFRPVNGREILEQLAQVPVQYWNYKCEADGAVPHIGPMAQDFKAAFFPGRGDKTISTMEFDGVALAAIQGLNQKFEAKLEQKEAEIADLKQRLERLEQLVRQPAR